MHSSGEQLPAITVFGSINIDHIMEVPHLPREGESLLGGVYQQVFGGKGANTAVAAARAGGEVCFLGCVGDDDAGQAMKVALAREIEDTDGILTIPGQTSGTAMILYDRQGNNCIAAASGANLALTPAMIAKHRELVSQADWLLLQMEIPAAANRMACDIAVRNGTKILLNYAPVIGDFSIGPEITVLVVNEVEAEALAGCPCASLEEALSIARLLVKQGPETVIVTLGEAGSVGAGIHGEWHIPACPVSVVDTTAAGDTFCGTLGVALAERKPLQQAVKFATAAAALSVTRAGAQPSIPRRSDIEALLARQHT